MPDNAPQPATSRRMFRQCALERLSEPEPLDQPPRLAPPGGWLSLLAVMLFLAAVLLMLAGIA